MKFTELLKLIIMSRSGYSSKRFCGIIGWITCLIILMFCSFTGQAGPDIFNIFIISTTALLGVDSITGIFRNNK